MHQNRCKIRMDALRGTKTFNFLKSDPWYQDLKYSHEKQIAICKAEKQQPDCFFFTHCAQCVLALHCSSSEISNCQEKQTMPYRQNTRVKKKHRKETSIHLNLTKACYICQQCGKAYFWLMSRAFPVCPFYAAILISQLTTLSLI